MGQNSLGSGLLKLLEKLVENRENLRDAFLQSVDVFITRTVGRAKVKKAEMKVMNLVTKTTWRKTTWKTVMMTMTMTMMKMIWI